MERAFKLTCWNVEWMVHDYEVHFGLKEPGSRTFIGTRPSRERAAAKLEALAETIRRMDSEVVFLCEAVHHPTGMKRFVDEFLPGYVVRQLPQREDAVGGVQGLSFLLKGDFAARTGAFVQRPSVWQTFTATASRNEHVEGKWLAHLPSEEIDTLGIEELAEHKHFRHPQVLVLDLDGTRVEIIGAHLKSKHIESEFADRAPNETDLEYLSRDDMREPLAQARRARAKLTTEAVDIRHYVNQRFAQDGRPVLILCGDLNDGPGKEMLERRFLMHDIMANLQGDVFQARQFLNHALFDWEERLRWTARFQDKLDPDRDPHILLDHIMFTEALSRTGIGSLIVEPFAGSVEHRVFEEVTSLDPDGVPPSDHRPVSLVVSRHAPAIG